MQVGIIRLWQDALQRHGAVRARQAALALSIATALAATGPEPGGAAEPPPAAHPVLDAGPSLGLDRLAPHRLEVLLDRIDDATDCCLRAGSVERRGARKAELSRLFEILALSPTARRLLVRARQADVYVCLDRETKLLAYYLSDLRLIAVNPALDEGRRIAFLAHELAHVPQHPDFSDNRHFPPNDLILLRRAREAAAEALASLILWELRDSGYAAGWRAKAAHRFYGDIARAFAAARAGRPNGRDLHVALRAAYDQWFAVPTRLDIYDRMTAAHLERISGDPLGLLPHRRHLTDRFLAGIGAVAGADFLRRAGGRSLTGPYYAGRLSAGNAARIEAVLESADPWPRRQDARARDGRPSAGAQGATAEAGAAPPG